MILGILLSLVLILSAVEFVSFNLSGHMKLFEKYNIPEETGLTMAELRDVMEDVLYYFKDDRKLLDTTINTDSVEAPAFGERAVLHMVDVKALFVGGRLTRNLSLAALMLLLVIIIKTDPQWKKGLAKAFLFTALGSFFLLGLLYILLQLDFNKYFNHFHEIFFDNDLWILDPKKELLIKMLPEGFFMDTAIKIVGYFAAGNILIGLLGLGGLGLEKRRP